MTDRAALYRLMAWLSPSYPVGAFSYSHGIEWLVEDGSITTLDALVAWLDDLLALGSGRNDAILFACAHRASSSGDRAALDGISEMALAFAASAERHLETSAQGRAFTKITGDAWATHTSYLSSLGEPAKPPGPQDPCRDMSLPPEVRNMSEPSVRIAAPRHGSSGHHFAAPEDDKPGKVRVALTYPVAVAVACADHGIPLESALDAYMHAFTANLVSAAVRLIPLGHTDGQRAMVRLETSVARAVEAALAATLEDLGSSTFLADIAAMKHETQHTRLFRS